MKICYAIGTYEPGGIGNIITNEAEGIQKLNHRAEIFCVKKRWDTSVKTRVFSSRFRPETFFASFKMINDMKLFDVVHVHGSVLLLAALLSGKPTVFTHHGWHLGVPLKHTELYTKLGSLFLGLFHLLLIPLSSKVIAISDYARKELKQIFFTNSIVLRDPVDFVKFRVLYHRVTDYKIGNPMILSVAANRPHKGHLAEIRAMADIVKTYPEAKLVLVGKWCDLLLPEINRLGLQKNVKIMGFITDDELIKLYNACDVYLTATYWELFGLPIIEAMFCGKPVITRKAFSMTELIDGSKAGELFTDDGEIAAKTIDAFRKRQIYGANALAFRAKFIKENNWDVHSKSLEKIYAELVNK
jgi:glycosyltransferase involved in cell wall biosynthesis